MTPISDLLYFDCAVGRGRGDRSTGIDVKSNERSSGTEGVSPGMCPAVGYCLAIPGLESEANSRIVSFRVWSCTIKRFWPLSGRHMISRKNFPHHRRARWRLDNTREHMFTRMYLSRAWLTVQATSIIFCVRSCCSLPVGIGEFL